MKPSRAPSVTAQNYDASMLARQVEYNECCARTSAHRFDCREAVRREPPVRRAR